MVLLMYQNGQSDLRLRIMKMRMKIHPSGLKEIGKSQSHVKVGPSCIRHSQVIPILRDDGTAMISIGEALVLLVQPLPSYTIAQLSFLAIRCSLI